MTATAVPGALATGALVVEDLTAKDFDERAVFHLMNLAREDGAYVLFTGREVPASLDIELRDLRSRLRAVSCWFGRKDYAAPLLRKGWHCR